jgi:hypothetical protein
VPIDRVSQGSGVMLLRDSEIKEMVAATATDQIELCLFLGPRQAWDIGAGRLSSNPSFARGRDQLAGCIRDAYRAVDLGVRSLLVGDVGVLWALNQLRIQGELPQDLKLKVSALIGATNPAYFSVLSTLGADSINVASDLDLYQIADMRQTSTTVIDIYLEAPDDLGGFVRLLEAPEIVRVACPVYLKFGLRNAPVIYPSGRHLADVAENMSRERVRRARLCLDLLDGTSPLPDELPMRTPSDHPSANVPA